MSFTQIVFYIFSFLAVSSALMVLLTKNILYAAFSLLGCFLGVAAIYVYAGADFIAITQILIYVGGILVLILFGIMLTGKVTGEKLATTTGRNILLGISVSILLLVLLIIGIRGTNFSSLPWIVKAKQADILTNGTVKYLGENLMTDYILPFELVGLILMVTIIGAAFIADKKNSINKS